METEIIAPLPAIASRFKKGPSLWFIMAVSQLSHLQLYVAKVQLKPSNLISCEECKTSTALRMHHKHYLRRSRMNDMLRINRSTASFIYLSSSNIHFRLLAGEERDLTELEASVELLVKPRFQFEAHTA